jgi:hypothetical protein
VEICSNDGEEGDKKTLQLPNAVFGRLLGQDLKSEALIKDQSFSHLEMLMWRNSPE